MITLPIVMTLIARVASRADAPDLARIYNEGIEDRLGTFETRLPSAVWRGRGRVELYLPQSVAVTFNTTADASAGTPPRPATTNSVTTPLARTPTPADSPSTVAMPARVSSRRAGDNAT